ncbi:RNA methyltransferase [Enterococcus asini]|uniref:TrmH family RNA methyltransferase n=1 Tax=Enterococcus asini TaxID=57732 RepID=UPI00288C87BA|nr:RNA methyltransferase [Enterococcus asini]MDT2756550.1 RNA methyltransferase [Enterococcus asini]
MKEIQGSKNSLIKELRKLHQKKYRDRQNRYLIEGFHLVEEGMKAQAEIEMLLLTEKGITEWGEWLASQRCEQYLITEELMASLSDLPTPPGIIAVIQKPQVNQEITKGRWLLLDRVQDPGNVGTMVRTADAAGFDGVVLGEGCADLYSTKVLRSMQGSHFHLPVVSGILSEVILHCQKNAIPVYGTELNEEAKAFQKVAVREEVALIMGNEGQGVAKELLAMTDGNLYIPIYGQAESLNVGVAAGILMYHFRSKI